MTQFEIDKDLICFRIKSCKTYEDLYVLLQEFVEISSKTNKKCVHFDEDIFPYGGIWCKLLQRTPKCTGCISDCEKVIESFEKAW